MKKKIISLLIGASLVASAMPVMATTEGIIQGDVLMTSEMIELNTFNGVIKEMAEGKIVVTIDELDYTFAPVEGMILDDIAVGDTVEIKSPSPLMTKDIKEATAVTKVEADALNAFEGILKSMDDTSATVEIDGIEYTFMCGETVNTTGINVGDTVKVLTPSVLKTKDIKEAAEIIKADTALADGEGETAAEAAMTYNTYKAVVNSFEDGNLNVTIEEDMVVSFRVTDDTFLCSTDEKAENIELAKGDNVYVISTSLLMTKDIKFADVVVKTEEDVQQMVAYNTFVMEAGQLISADGSLVLNVENAKELAGKKLLVFYSMNTMSIPAQTTPDRIVIIETPDAVETVKISFNIGDTTLDINGEKVEVVAPYIVGEGTTLVPLRVISEAFGAAVEWIAETKSVEIVDGETKITLQIDNKTAIVNDEEKALDAPAELTDDTTMVPLRFISETLGAEVGYVHETQLITVER